MNSFFLKIGLVKSQTSKRFTLPLKQKKFCFNSNFSSKNDHRKEQRYCPTSSISVHLNLFFHYFTIHNYLYTIKKGTSLPSYPVRINSGPTPYQLRVPFFGDNFMGRLCFLSCISFLASIKPTSGFKATRTTFNLKNRRESRRCRI
jgi:hypothetical protein